MSTAAAQTTTQTDALKLELQLPQEPIHKDAREQNVTVLITNTSANDVTFLRTNPLHDFDILIKDAQGTEVPMTERGKQLLQAQNEVFVSVAMRTLKPEESTETLINLHYYYDLQPGRYIVQVRRHIPRTANKANTTPNAASSNSQAWISSPFTVVP